ncbi:MAG: hypothetical protein RRA92_07250 [Gemmatimonadota bacterium]|nr:hypothetical protein [Gemmatimonadota bacterium]
MSASDRGPQDASVRVPAAAKLNLRLRVLGREESGFHGIETLFLRLALCDEVEVAPGPAGISLAVEGAERVPGGPGNLVWRAAAALCEAAERPPALRIRLVKRIPAEAGLGGGSADAAATLRAVHRLLGEPLPPERLVDLAATLGSDVPFGLAPTALALAWERGRRLLPLSPPPSRPVLLARPAQGIATADAYGWLAADRRRAAGPAAAPVDAPAGGLLLPEPSVLARWESLVALAGNDFEGPVFSRRAGLARLRDAFAESGALLALLCGSGACVAGIYADREARDAARGDARLRDAAAAEAATFVATETQGPAAG